MVSGFVKIIKSHSIRLKFAIVLEVLGGDINATQFRHCAINCSPAFGVVAQL